jgi:hypothetical protein
MKSVKGIRIFSLDVLSLRCLFDIQVESLSKQYTSPVPRERFRLAVWLSR